MYSEFTTKPGKVSRGTFFVQNNQLTPVAVIIEVGGMVKTEQGLRYMPIDPTACRVDLSSTGARLGPKESREFSYHIQCFRLPYEVSFQIGMILGKTSS